MNLVKCYDCKTEFLSTKEADVYWGDRCHCPKCHPHGHFSVKKFHVNPDDYSNIQRDPTD